jgi:hypothetical protein
MKITSLHSYLVSHKNTNFSEILGILASMHDKFYCSCDKWTQELYKQYVDFFNEVLEYSPSDVKEMIIVDLNTRTGEPFIDINMNNPDFVELPDYSLSPWGGNDDDKTDCPLGYYNVNWKGYIKRYGLGATPFENLVFNDIEVTEQALEFLSGNIHSIMAEVVYELTVYGFTKEDRQSLFDMLHARLKQVKTQNKE